MLVAMLLAALLSACATPSPPYGGPKDEVPPQVITEESSPNPATNFTKEDEIRIEFDEWVEINDPATQIVITPPMLVRPEISLKGKAVVVAMNDEVTLADNTTYTINFGEAIRDITERNPIRNFTYVFSTGDFVDSLSLDASLLSVEGEPVENALLILHESSSDSAIIKLLPTYFTTASASTGTATLEYLRADTFTVYGLQDVNGNFRYDLPEEKVGFYDGRIILSDTTTVVPEVILFDPLVPIRIEEAFTTPGKRKVRFSRDPLDLGVLFSRDSEVQWDYHRDTLFLWNFGRDTVRAFLSDDGAPFDTLRVPPADTSARLPTISTPQRSIHPDFGLEIRASDPITAIDTSRVRIFVGDSARLSTDSVVIGPQNLTFMVYSGWEEKQRVNIYFDEGAVTSAFNEVADSTEIKFNIGERMNYGLYEIDILNLSAEYSYIFKLIGKDREMHSEVIPRELVPVDSTEAYRIVITKVPVGEYTVVLEEDRNNNGRWDTGSLEGRRQPELIYRQQLQPGRPGWDVNVSITWPYE